MVKNKEPVYIIGGDINVAYPFATDTVKCCECSKMLKITDVSKKMIEEKGAKPICFECMSKKSGKKDFRISKEQTQEILEFAELQKFKDISSDGAASPTSLGTKIVLDGEFTMEDLKKIAVCLREIEMQNPTKTYFMLLGSTEKTPTEAISFVREIMVETLVRKFGEFKKVVVGGMAYKVPTREIIVKGIKAWEIPDKYPIWKEDEATTKMVS